MWDLFFRAEKIKDYYNILEENLKNTKNSKVYPPSNLILRAFNETPLDDIKVVILGQDPYHGEGQAEGLSFSVPDGIKKPPSLRNIFKEWNDDLGYDIPENGSLSPWSKEGVFLLNSILTVEEKLPGSHAKFGWEEFTDNAIRFISDNKKNVVFVLWGAYAQKKESLINKDKHFIIKSPHPSPFSARKGFFGSKPFSRTNNYLESKNIKPINWKL